MHQARSRAPLPRSQRPAWRRAYQAFIALNKTLESHEDRLRQRRPDGPSLDELAAALAEARQGLLAAGLAGAVRPAWSRWHERDAAARKLLLRGGKDRPAAIALAAREPRLTTPDGVHAVNGRIGNFAWTLLDKARPRFCAEDLPAVVAVLKSIRKAVDASAEGLTAKEEHRLALELTAALHPSDPTSPHHNDDLYRDPGLPHAATMALRGLWEKLKEGLLFRDRG